MLTFEQQIERAEKRWRQAAPERKAAEREILNLMKGKASDWRKLDSPQRLVARMEGLGLGDAADALIHAEIAGGNGLDFNPVERIIEESELAGIEFFERGIVAARAVARIRARSPAGARQFGTGFMVSPRLMLTNNHVLPTAGWAGVSVVEFGYLRGGSGRFFDPLSFTLEPEAFFVTDDDLDFTLVAVREANDSGYEVTKRGWCPLIRRSGKATVGEPLNIIQHPGGERMQATVRDNRLTGVVGDFLHYRADTRPGSSGAPVFSDQWEVAALHHAGVPDRDGNGRILLADGTPWSGRVEDQDRIRWIANEGTRISRIVAHVEALGLKRERRALFDDTQKPPRPLDLWDLFEQTALAPETLPGAGGSTQREPAAGPRPEPDGSVSWLFRVNFGPVGGPVTPAAMPDRLPEPPAAARRPDVAPPAEPGSAMPPTPVPAPVAIEAAAFAKERWGGTAGYDPGFLGNDIEVPIPRPACNADIQKTADGEEVLRYHHFSVVMSASRRLAMVAAVNVDAGTMRQLARRDRWRLDPRLARERQIDNDCYANNDLDRGHLVRRISAGWGSRTEAQKGEDDTFHYTNCAPQHRALNQRTWLDLEDYIIDTAREGGAKALIFTGPVFRPDDMVYRETYLIPAEFWKAAAALDDDGELHAAAYLQTQKNLLPDVVEAAFGDYKTWRVPVATIAGLTGLDFGPLLAADGRALEEGSARVAIVRGAADLDLF